MKNEGLLIVMCGPSGAGKGTIYNAVLNRMPNVKRSVSVTTRKPRPGEYDGIHYHFRSIETYRRMIANGEFLETAAVFNNFYGTPKAPVMEMLSQGYDVMFEIDVVGAKQIKSQYAESILIFIMTPDFATLKDRLIKRGTETEDGLRTRIGGAKGELSQYEMFDYIVFNDDVDSAVDQVESIIKAEKCRIKRNTTQIKNILGE